MLGAAAQRLPVLVDGFICSAAYVAALAICPDLAGYAVLSHASAEPGHGPALARLDSGVSGGMSGEPLLHLNMRLGEGTGAVAAMPLLDMARAVYMDCYTFEEGGIEAYTPQGGEG